MKRLNEMISNDQSNLGKGFQIGHSYFVPSEGQYVSEEWFDNILRYEIKPLVEEYYCDDQAQLAKALDVLEVAS